MRSLSASPDMRQAGKVIKGPGSSAANLQQQINDLKARIAFYNACKPPRIKAATACMMKLHDLVMKQLKREVRAERRAS